MSKIKNTIRALLPSGLKYQLKSTLNTYFNYRMLRKHKLLSTQKHGDFPMGINLIGDIKAETGLGQSMRILASALENNEIPFIIIQENQPGDLKHDNDCWDHKIESAPKYAVNLIHINAGDWAEYYMKLPSSVLAGRYNVAYWLWELEDFPKRWLPCVETIDEVWAPSNFICDCLRRCINKPILKVPYHIELEIPVKYDRAHFGFPEETFLFLIMYDFKSVSQRKNPKGMVDAFRQAFTYEEANENNIGLVIKINHLENSNELEMLKTQLCGYQYIYYVTDNLSRLEVEALVASVDVYVSLHRSEGFGLPAAEAMYLGTPVIATNWSATTEFMSEKTACLVDCQMITLNRQMGPYPKGSRWADADIEQAAEYMKRLYRDNDYYQSICESAKQAIRQQLNSEAVGNIIRQRLGEIDKIFH